jgi:hypothetical protein
MRTMGKSCKMIVYVCGIWVCLYFFVFLDMKLVVEDNATLMKMMDGFASGPMKRMIRIRERIRRWWKIVWVPRLFL